MDSQQNIQKRQKTNALNLLILCAISLILVMQLHLQFVQKINWDEFYFLSLVYDYQRGDLSKPLQTAHVHFFGWLKYISPNEVTQIIAARVVMWGLQLGTLYFIFKTACRFISTRSALFAVLSYLGFGFIFIHGTSFRADPIATFLVTGLIYIFVATPLNYKNLAALSAALALALLVTIKVIFFAPLFAALALWRLSTAANKKALFLRLSMCAGVSIMLFALGYLVQLNIMPSADVVGSKDMLGNAGRTTLLESGWFPRSLIIQQHFIFGLISTLMLFLGFLFILLDIRKEPSGSKRLVAILAMGLPLLSLIFYRNAFPYFFAFVFPTVILWAGYAAERLKKMPILLGLLALMIVINIGVQYKFRLNETHHSQYVTLKELHRIFPETVNYIDKSSMMSSYAKSGFFMSSWGLKNYRAKNDPVLTKAMKAKVIPVLIDNSPEISRALHSSKASSLLLARDQLSLRENFIPHWGQIWIAGKALSVSPQDSIFENLVPGKYTLQSNYPVLIDGISYASGDVVFLARGQHRAASGQLQDIKLRWGNTLQAPDMAAPTQPIFTNF
ncbi:MAG: hypothetical protein ABJN69_11965 [Hellea sp.]